MQEIWKDIPNYNGRYQVSNYGNIKSFAKSSSGRLMKPCATRGYYYVCLSNGKKQSSVLVHRLVAKSFVPNPYNYNEINHKDENKANNNADNLEWCSRSYNMEYGTARLRQGISCGNPVIQFTLQGLPLANYYSAAHAGSINHIDPSSIIKCCKGKRHSAGGYKWQFAN